MFRYRLGKAVGLWSVAVAVMLMVAFMAGWPLAKQGAAESTSGGNRFAAWLHRLGNENRGRATFEIQLDHLLDELGSDGSGRFDREQLTRLVQDIAGNDVPIDELRLGDLLDEVPGVRVTYQGKSVVLGRQTLTRIAARMVETDVAIEEVWLSDLLDGLSEMHVNLDVAYEGLDAQGLASVVREMIGSVKPVDLTRDPQFHERQALQLQYADVVNLVQQLKREGFALDDPNAIYDEALRRLRETNQDDAILLLDGHQRLEEELAAVDLASMSRPERIAWRWQARRRAFGDDLAELLFNRREAMERYDIDRLTIEADDSTAEEKAGRIRHRREALKVELAARGTYVGFADEVRAEVEAELREHHGDQFDRMTADERTEALRQAYLARLPVTLRDQVESMQQAQTEKPGADAGDFRKRRLP